MDWIRRVLGLDAPEPAPRRRRSVVDFDPAEPRWRAASAKAHAGPDDIATRWMGRREATRTGADGHRSADSQVRFGLDELVTRSGLSLETLRDTLPTYRSVSIPKRSGSGERVLRVPDDAAKAVQRRLLHGVLDRVPVHPAAHGFERGRSIVTNARPHARRPVVIRMDVVDFFGTTSARRVRRLFRVLGWDAETADILTRLTTDGGSLPQGAPSSPRLANLVNVRLDARLTALAQALGADYTRYADDLTFSFSEVRPGAIADLIGGSRRIVRHEGYRLHLDRKLQIRRGHHRQSVTGLVVNDHVALPRTRRRWLRAVAHHLETGRPATLTEDQLAGWRAFQAMIERAPPLPPPPADPIDDGAG